MKAIICMQGKANIGKTHTLRKVYEKLNPHEKTILEQPNDDIYATIKMGDFLIGIATQGDPMSGLKERLNELMQKSCDIIVCASRSKGYTVEDVENSALQNGYSLIWSSPFVTEDKTLRETCQDYMAQSIINLINGIAYV